MTDLLAIMALLGLCALGAFSGDMTDLTAVVTCGGAAFTACILGGFTSYFGGLGFPGHCCCAGGRSTGGRSRLLTRSTSNSRFITSSTWLARAAEAAAALDWNKIIP